MTPEKDLSSRSLRALWHPCTQMKHHEAVPPVAIVKGEGPWLVDARGRRLLDGISSWWVNLFGHCNPRINRAIVSQLARIEHAMLAGFTHEPVVALSERLGSLTGGTLGHAFYGSDGAAATEIALKMSAHYWRNEGRPEKHQFIYLAGSYHGETAGALSVTDIPLFREAYAPLIRTARVVPSPDGRFSGSPDQAAADALAALDTLLAQHHESIAALIVEPLVQCASGMAMHAPAYLRGARALCNQYEVHLIADEIAVGFGRTGSFFACQQADIWPDMMCLSKGISGGYLPLSAVLTTDTVFEAFLGDDTARGFLHSHSYTGNPLACSAALATLDIFEEDDVLTYNRARARWLMDGTRSALAGLPIRHLRQQGMILAFDVDTSDPAFSRKYFAAALDNGLLLRPIGNTVYFMPPYVLDQALCEQLAAGAAETLQSVLDRG